MIRPARSTTPLVLVVDDDPDVRDMLTAVLEREGYRAITRENGAEALEWLRQADELPAVILLDLMMPVMNGWEFRGAQKKDPAVAGVPVVVISATGAARERTGLLGVRDVIVKPIRIDELLATIEAAITPDRPSLLRRPG